LHEHSVKIGKEFRNYFTCRKEMDTCPLCEAGYNTSYVLVATIISHKKWKDKSGKIHTNQKQLIVFKSKAREAILRRIKKNDGDITRCVFEMSRGTAQGECATGEDFELIKQLSPKEIKQLVPAGEDVEKFLKPLDYAKLLAPKEIKELSKIAGQAAPIGSDDYDDDDDDDKKDKKKKSADDDDDNDSKDDDDDNGKSEKNKKSKKSDDDDDDDSPKSIDDLL
jgi:cobalamin biosynthesis protein CobT